MFLITGNSNFADDPADQARTHDYVPLFTCFYDEEGGQGADFRQGGPAEGPQGPVHREKRGRGLCRLRMDACLGHSGEERRM